MMTLPQADGAFLLALQNWLDSENEYFARRWEEYALMMGEVFVDIIHEHESTIGTWENEGGA